jgi:hypothetical protein
MSDEKLRSDDIWLRYYDGDQPLTEATRVVGWRLHIADDGETVGFTPSLSAGGLDVISAGTITHIRMEDALGRERYRGASPGEHHVEVGDRVLLPEPTIVLVASPAQS